MSINIGQFNEEIIKGQIKKLVRGSVEEDLIEVLPGRRVHASRRGHHRGSVGQ